MTSFYDSIYLEDSYVPVVHAYYDRANMMESTQGIVDHAHSLCEIMYVNEGMMSIETMDSTIRVGRGQFIWLDANIPHRDLLFAEGLCSMMNIEFQYEAIPNCGPSLAAIAQSNEAMRNMLAEAKRVLVLTDKNHTISRYMKEIIHLANSTHRTAEKLCSLLCTQLMLEVAALSSQHRTCQPSKNRYVSEALAIMQSDYAEPLTAALLAAQLHIQPTYLHRLFREHTVRTMNEHLQHIRIENAKNLLSTTSKNLLEIAGEVGINSQQHFSQLFKKIVGISPLEYRNREKQKLDSKQPTMAEE